MNLEFRPTSVSAANDTQSNAPLISIIVPNYNGGKFLDDCLKSIFEQDYPHVEIIVIDGGSTDESIEIIRKYLDKLAFYISEPDRGQANAINKGFRHISGAIVNWLCSDDQLEPHALKKVAEVFISKQDIDVVVGASRWLYHSEGRYIIQPITYEKIGLILWGNYISQPSCFYRAKLLNRTPPLREDLQYAMDLELWLYFQKQHAIWFCIDDVLSTYTWHDSNKTSTGKRKIVNEINQLYRIHVGDYLPMFVEKVYLPIRRLRERSMNKVKRKATEVLERIIRKILRLRYGHVRTDEKIEQYNFFIGNA